MARRPVRKSTAPVSTQDAPYATFGISGLTRYGGVSRIYEEFERTLQGPLGMRAYREMIDNDPIIGAILFAAQHLLRPVRVFFEAADQSEEAKAVATFVEECIFEDMETSWPETLSEILSMCGFGWALMEMTFKRRRGMSDPNLVPDPTPPSGQGTEPAKFVPSRFKDGKVGFKSWSLRSQETLFMWEFDEQSRATVMQQMAPPDFTLRRIPLSKALLFRTQQSKGSPEGRSLLRNAWTSYLLKKNIQIFEAVGVERNLAGYPIIQMKQPDKDKGLVPPDVWNTKDLQATALLNDMKNIVRNARQDEQFGVVMPWWAEFKLISAAGTAGLNTSAMVDRYSKYMSFVVLADFISLGHDAVGSKALASTKTALFAAGLGSIYDGALAVINRQALPLLLELNGIPQALAPTMKRGEIDTIDLADLGEYLSKLSGAGMPLFPSVDGELEHAVMRAARLPEPSDPNPDTLEEPVVTAPTPVPVQPGGPQLATAPAAAPAPAATEPNDRFARRRSAKSTMQAAVEGLTKIVKDFTERPGPHAPHTPSHVTMQMPNVTVQMPPQPAPTVNVTVPPASVTVNVPPQPPAQVTVAAPEVHVTVPKPDPVVVNLPAPDVKVTVDKTAPRPRKITFDKTGRSATIE